MFGPTHPLRYFLSYNGRKALRAMQDLVHAGEFAHVLQLTPLAQTINQTDSPIFRNFAGVRRELFVNKITNLRLALEKINGILIEPDSVFSFWHLTGRPTAQKGYLPGLVIERGRPAEGIGGGLCQLANMIHWLALHSDLTVTERHRHSFDIFPDDNRTVPFAGGATIVYNYKDLRLHNTTDNTYQLLFTLDENRLCGGLYAAEPQQHHYTVIERDHGFETVDGQLYRRNRIYQLRESRQSGTREEKLISDNYCRCQYSLDEVQI
ncbi:MAG: VanW family protein [Gammaproteobacteria bacterium]|nr:VanW family protein [Gammaproteobacteria bacterium]MDH5651954.1 VanW family protein [Gammaproteobacteria bacterium]